MAKKKRLLSILIAVLMLFTAMPAMARTARAARGTPAIRLVTDGVAENIIGAQNSSVWYGNYPQSSDGADGFNIEPIKWRVLQNADKNLLLFADQVLDCRKYREKETRTRWYFSDLRSWLNGLDNYWTGLENDYTDDNFKDEAFTAKELAAIADTHVVTPENPDYELDGGPDSTDKLFILSCQEALTPAYGFSDAFPYRDEIGTRIMTATDYAKSLGVEVHTSTDPRYDGKTSWWLRTYCDIYANPVTTGVDYRGRVWTDGIGPVISTDIGVVPAFNLDLESVLFTSAAAGGKASGAEGADALRAVSDTSASEWKMTLKDADRNFEISDCSNTENGVSVAYTGAKTGDNEYISAVITDSSGNITYYGRLKKCTAAEDGSGTVTINTGDRLRTGDTLYVFNEQYNGDKKTDYASELKQFVIEKDPKVTKHALILSDEIGVQFRVAFPEDFDTSSFFIEFAAADGRTSTVTYDQAAVIDGSADRHFIFRINPLELAEEITATLHYGDNETAADTYSAMEYIDYVQDNMSDDPKLPALANALHAYGYYMQKSGWTDDKGSHTEIPEPEQKLTPEAVQAAAGAVSDYGKTENFSDSGLEASSFSLTLNAQTVINISVRPGNGVTILSPGYKTVRKEGATWYRFCTPKIGPKDLGEDYTVTVETDQGRAEISASAMAYVKAILNGEYPAEQKDAMAAYYYYYAAAYAY